MKIAFLCGALEPGKDGVGDYTRMLALGLEQHGIQTLLIAFNDHFIHALVKEKRTNGSILRLPAALISAERLSLVRQALEHYQPDWVSLQFVPYSFQKKGLPYQLAKTLQDAGNYNWHIMFHELWMDAPENRRQQLIALLQKQIIRRLVKRLKPQVIHVSLPFNKMRLQGTDINSNILPLFGNIPYAGNHISRTEFPHKSVLYFGGAPRGTYLSQVLQGIEACYKKGHDALDLIIVSGNSENKKQFVNGAKQILSGVSNNVIEYSFLSEEELSNLMMHCTAGIARSEPQLLGKSGSATAMLEHGLPIWLPKWKADQPADFEFRGNLVHSTLTDALNTPHETYEGRLGSVTKQFITDLQLS